MNIKSQYTWAYCCIFLLLTVFLYGQDSLSIKPAFKPNVKIYPSAQVMYGLLYYSVEAGDKNETFLKYYNQNFNVGVYLNADLQVQSSMYIQFYVGYNRWNFCNLVPIGLMIKPRINKKQNEFYLKFGGGYSIGKRYEDINDKLHVTTKPNDYGTGSVHLQAGLEKNWHLANKKSLSLGYMLSLQFIKSYYAPFSYGSNVGKPHAYFIPYKFAGLTLAYHFY